MKPENVGKNKLPQGSVIFFDDTSGHHGYGTIVGIATNPVVILGYGYIVEPHSKIEGLDYKTCIIYEIWIDERKTKIINLGI